MNGKTVRFTIFEIFYQFPGRKPEIFNGGKLVRAWHKRVRNWQCSFTVNRGWSIAREAKDPHHLPAPLVPNTSVSGIESSLHKLFKLIASHYHSPPIALHNAFRNSLKPISSHFDCVVSQNKKMYSHVFFHSVLSPNLKRASDNANLRQRPQLRWILIYQLCHVEVITHAYEE